MKVPFAAEMKTLDQQAIEKYNIPGIVLMENAGVCVAHAIEDIAADIGNIKVCIFCGKGNNGGDGLVAARHLFNKGARVKVFMFGTPATSTSDAATNFRIVEALGIDCSFVETERDWDKVKLAATFSEYIVDALVGTGFHGALDETLSSAANIINDSGKKVISVDIPSGVNADDGQVKGVAVKADYTVTFSLPKPGLFLYPGALYAGKIIIADIGMPVNLTSDSFVRQNIITTQLVKKILPKRKPDAHKGLNGRVLVVAGSRGLTGAAALCSMAAVKSGAGLVTLGIADCLHDIMEAKLTEVMTYPLPDVRGVLTTDALKEILLLTQKRDVLAIGPGMGSKSDTLELVRQLVQKVECPLVLDADALNALAGFTDILPQLPVMAVLTPHPGEMARLMGLTAKDINSNRLKVARQAAISWKHIVVLKGAPTIVAFPDGEVYINTTGNEGMATGGTGDVLTGIIAAFIAQGLSSHDAALAGVFIHGLAGDIACRELKTGITASEINNAVPGAIFGVLST